MKFSSGSQRADVDTRQPSLLLASPIPKISTAEVVTETAGVKVFKIKA